MPNRRQTRRKKRLKKTKSQVRNAEGEIVEEEGARGEGRSGG